MMQPEPRTRLIVQSGANGSLSTIVPAYGSLTSTRSSAAQSSLYGDWFLGSAMRSNEELDVVRGQLAEAAGELHAHLSMKSMWRSVNLLDRCRRQSQVSPGFALIRFEKIASIVALGLGEPVQGVRHLKVGIGADPERAPVLRPDAPWPRERAGAERRGHQQERSPVESHESHRPPPIGQPRRVHRMLARSRECA
jgi:hypothetical protein